MAYLKKKETVESPSRGEHAIVRRPAREIEFGRGFDTIFDDFRRSFDDLLAPFLPMRTYFPSTFGTIPFRAPLVDVIEEAIDMSLRPNCLDSTKTIIKIF